nr:hypothetical protein [Tanacetum cinerariifolium]
MSDLEDSMVTYTALSSLFGDPEEDPTDYPTDGGDDDDDESSDDDKDDDDDESSDDDKDDDDDAEEDEDGDEEEEEEHPALADSIPLPPVHRVTARLSIKEQPPTPVGSELRAKTPSASHPLPSGTPPSGTPPLLPIPLLTPSPPLILPSTSHKADVPEAARPTRGFRVDYSFVATFDDEIRRDPERESMDASNLARSEVMALRTQVVAQHSKIMELWAANHGRQAQFIEALKLLKTLQTQMTAIQRLSQNGKDSHDSGMGVRRQAPPARECTYQDFMKCKPLYFKGTEGVVKLTQWFERMETVFRIRNYTVENQIKFVTCTLLGSALTWWNYHVMTVGLDVAYAMTWTNLRKKMTDKYCPRGKIKKLEGELWNLRVKSNDVVGYNQRFQELTLLCVRMFPEESDKVKRYVHGLPDMIHGSIVTSRPKTMQEEIEMPTELMDKRNNTFAERQAENKQKFDDTSKKQSKPTTTEKEAEYRRGLQCKCTPKCHKCNRLGHLACDCKSAASANTANNQRGTGKSVCDTGADRSFVSTAFSSQIDILPTSLDHYYDVELADGRILRLNTILRGC